MASEVLGTITFKKMMYMNIFTECSSYRWCSINSQERQAVITLVTLARAKALVLHLGCAEKLWGDLVKM